MADGTGHKILTRAAIEVLPQWMQKLLDPERKNLENEYCMYGDSYFIDKERIGPFIELPDGRLPMDPWEIRHFRKDAPGEDYYTCGYYDLMRCSFEYFADKCIETIKNNDIASFAKFTGSIAHIIQDCGTPPHAVGTEMGTDMKMIKLLYPTADNKKMAGQFHCILESKFEPFSMDYTPTLLGLSPAEISFNMLESFTDMLENSISYILPVLDAYYSDNEKMLAQKLSECGKLASEILADFIYSTISVATKKTGNSEKELLNSVILSEYTTLERTAWAPFPYPYCEIRKAPWSLNEKFEPIELSLMVDGKTKTFDKGFGIGPPFEINFIIPQGVYKQFESSVGINNKLGSETGIVFKIIGDGKELALAECRHNNDSKMISADISNIEKITLKIEAANHNNIWPSNSHAIWGNPKLLK